MDESSLAQLAGTLALALRVTSHGLASLGARLDRLEARVAELRALASLLAAQRARREPEPVAPVQREAA